MNVMTCTLVQYGQTRPKDGAGHVNSPHEASKLLRHYLVPMRS